MRAAVAAVTTSVRIVAATAAVRRFVIEVKIRRRPVTGQSRLLPRVVL
jgi:hypothetical protein